MARDEKGHPFLLWKEDGNSIGKPTPIWAQPLADDLIHSPELRHSSSVNDPATWEGGVVEAPYIMRHDRALLSFYAGNACCGTACHYAEGVARADHLLGPWMKDPANPIIRPNSNWKCPGHGTAVETASGKDYFIYHAYPATGTIYLGRESVLDRITWFNGWPVINGGAGPSGGTTEPNMKQPTSRITSADQVLMRNGNGPCAELRNGRSGRARSRLRHRATTGLSLSPALFWLPATLPLLK